MNKTVITLLASMVVIGAAFAGEHPSEHPKPGGTGALDGKVFVGQLTKAGEKSGDKDKLTFEDGKFVSSACVRHGFHETAYTTTEKNGVITFTSTSTNNRRDTMAWTGTIKQGVLEGTAVNKSESGETTYSFKGTMGPAQPKDHQKKSEHPEHPEHPK